jgi:DNA-binding NtrC family response regulator
MVVTEAADGESATVLLQVRSFDVVICDKNLPDISGLEIIRRAKAVDPTVGTLLITGFSSRESAEEAMLIGVDDYIVKPFEIEDLRTKVKDSLDRRKLRGAVTPITDRHPLRLHVLICDPSQESQELLLAGVKLLGHTFESASDLTEVLELIDVKAFDGLICDLDLLKRDKVRATMLRLKLITLPEIRFISVASGKDLASAISSLQSGASKVLFRPLGSGELVAGSLREFFGDAGIIRATDNKVLIARSNLEVGQPLTRNNIETIELPRELRPVNVVTWHELDRVSGQKLRVERLKGDLILWSCFN